MSEPALPLEIDLFMPVDLIRTESQLEKSQMHLQETLLLWSRSEFQDCNSAVLGLSGRCLPAPFQFRDADSTPG